MPVTAARSLPAVEERRAGDPPAVWGNIPPRNNNFTGRQALLDTLHERLSSEGTAAVLPEALHGLGGVGKSQIALEFVYQHHSDYDAVWWIPAERPEQIRQALVQLAVRLGLQVGLESNIAAPSVLEALRTGRPCRDWLLVFDNAEELETVWPIELLLRRGPELARAGRPGGRGAGRSAAGDRVGGRVAHRDRHAGSTSICTSSRTSGPMSAPGAPTYWSRVSRAVAVSGSMKS